MNDIYWDVMKTTIIKMHYTLVSNFVLTLGSG